MTFEHGRNPKSVLFTLKKKLSITGRTPLHIAALSNSIGCMKLLLKRQSSVESRDIKGRTPLILAALNGHSEAIELLLNAKANITSQDKLKNTALHYACWGQHHSAALILLQKSKENTVVNITNKHKQT